MANILENDLNEINPPLQDVAAIKSLILEGHQEPARKYYTIQRAARVRQLLLNYTDEFLVNPSENLILSTKLAIWFHDIVRNPSWDDCEERSSEIALKALGGAYNVNRNAVKNTILSFRTHKAMPHTVTSCALDADITVLSYPEEVYFRKYLPALRADYGRFSDVFWAKKRTEYIENILSREKIYFNIPSLEEQARNNLTKELNILSKNAD